MRRRFVLANRIRPEIVAAHRARWFARVGPCEEAPDGWLPRNRYMAGKDWGWDVRCSCGWHSSTGGGIEAYTQEVLDEHRWDAQYEADLAGS